MIPATIPHRVLDEGWYVLTPAGWAGPYRFRWDARDVGRQLGQSKPCVRRFRVDEVPEVPRVD